MTVVGVVVKSARDLWPVVALMLLILFVFTVLGMQLFGATINPLDEDYGEEDYAVKMRFDTFFWSFVQVSCPKAFADYSFATSYLKVQSASWRPLVSTHVTQRKLNPSH